MKYTSVVLIIALTILIAGCPMEPTGTSRLVNFAQGLCQISNLASAPIYSVVLGSNPPVCTLYFHIACTAETFVNTPLEFVSTRPLTEQEAMFAPSIVTQRPTHLCTIRDRSFRQQ